MEFAPEQPSSEHERHEVDPPEPELSAGRVLLDPYAHGCEQVRIEKVREHRVTDTSKPSLARTQARERNRQHHQHQRRDRHGRAPRQFGAIFWLARGQQRRGGLHLDLALACLRCRQAHGYPVFAELHDAPVRRAWHAFVAAPVVENEHLFRLARTALHRPVGHRDLDLVADIALHEHAVQLARLLDALGVEHRFSAGETAESTRLERAELGGPCRLESEIVGLHPRSRHHAVGQHREQDRNHHRQQCDRPVDPQRPDTTGGHGRHLALVVQAAQRQHDPQEQADGHEHRELLQRGEADQRQHDLAWKAARRCLTQHPRELVRQQHDQQHAGDRDEGPRHFAQQITVQAIEQSSRASAGIGKLAG